jgi:hypothetical protein
VKKPIRKIEKETEEEVFAEEINWRKAAAAKAREETGGSEARIFGGGSWPGGM